MSVYLGKTAPKGCGLSDHELYGVWRTMLNRCHDPRSTGYARYGALGVVVCDRWRRSFVDFLADVGERPSGKGPKGRSLFSLDRINPALGYEPNNVRWATDLEQAHNKRVVKLEPHEPAQIRWLRSEGYSCGEIARFFDVTKATVSQIALNKTRKAAA